VPRRDEFDQWLDTLGLGKHSAALAAQGVDFDALPRRSDDQLTAIGLSVPEVLSLRSALQGLGATAGHAVSGRPGERRQITVMFCDLVNWTAWANRLDPEDLTRLTSAYYSLCCRQIERYGGFNARFEGDGILAYFGYPAAREDAVECAIRAGLAVVEVVGSELLDGSHRCEVRVGLATGLAVVGDMVGAGFAESSVVMGHTPSLAKRLQSLAEPGTVTVSDETRRLAGGLFDFADAGLHVVKGFEEDVRVWRVAGESTSGVRFDWRRASRYECVGRETPIAQLQAAWDRAGQGSCTAVTIVGDAGVGKSRLLRAAAERFEPAPRRAVIWQCSSSQGGTPLHPVISWLLRETGVSRLDAAENQRLLEAWIGAGATPLSVALLAEFLSVPLARGSEPLRLPPDRRQELTRDAVASHFERAGGRMLLILEDAHWIDRATHDFVDWLLRRLHAQPLLALVSTRFEHMNVRAAAESGSEIRLEPLAAADAERLVLHVCGGRRLPGTVMAAILKRADGVPLFVEELTATVLDRSGWREEGDELSFDGPLPALEIPATLHDSLRARLDHLGDVAEVARVGSAIGREFTFDLLAHVTGQPAGQLEAALDRLLEARLLFRSEQSPRREYIFKHALVQQAAYDGQLRSSRQALHAKIVAAIETHQPDVARHEPGLMAHHCRLAGMIDREVDYLYAAGVASTRMVAIPEALAAFEQAEATLEQLEDSPRNAERRIGIIVGMMEVGRFAILPGRLVELSERARALSRQEGVNCDAATLAAILFQDGRARLYTSRYAEARSIFLEIRALGVAQGSLPIERKPASAFSMGLCCQGLFDETLDFINERNIDYYKESGSFIDYVAGLGWIGYAKCQTGDGDAGVQYGDLSLREAEQLRSRIYVSGACIWRSHALMAVRRLDEAVADAQRSLELATEQSVPYLRWHALVFLALCLCRSGRLDSAGESLAEARTLLEREAEGQWSLLDYLPAIEAEVACFGNDHARALRLADEAIAIAAPIGGDFAHALALRVKAITTLRAGGEPQAAQRWFDAAAALHERGGAWAEAAFSALVWAHALFTSGHAEQARRWGLAARALADRHRLVLERCEHGAAAMLRELV
jgi:class 3 adenylate cyclase